MLYNICIYTLTYDSSAKCADAVEGRVLIKVF